MPRLESQPNPDRQIHFNLLNESKNIPLGETQAIDFAQNQVNHYLAEHVLGIKHPWLIDKEGVGAYSYKLKEETDPMGKRNHLMPVGYDNKTSFTALCSNPYLVLSTRLAGKSPESVTQQEKRVLERAKAEMTGAILFEQLALHSKDGDLIVWFSPPGNPEDGYWDSSIIYVAKIEETETGKELECYRCIHNLTLQEHIDFLNQLSFPNQGIGENSSAEDVVANPVKVNPTKLTDVNQLIDYLHLLDGKKYQSAEVQSDLKKMAAIKKAVAPKIADLVYYLQTGNKTKADQCLDSIEKEAMRIYYDQEQLLEIAYKTNPQNYFDLPVNQYDQALAAAFLARRQEMQQRGTSCPGIRNRDPITGQERSLDPHQQLMDHLQDIISKESSEFRCPRCGVKLNKNATQCSNCGQETCLGLAKKRASYL